MFRTTRPSLNRKRTTRLGSESLEARNLLSVNISEIHFRPTLADPLEDQYLEIRGTPNSTIADNTFFVGIESDGDDAVDNPGKINAIFDLSGLTIGSNGYLVFIQENAGFSVDSEATVFQGDQGGFRGIAAYQGFTGQFESISGSETWMIVDTTAAQSAPVLSSDVDTDDDGVIDAGTNWTVVDSVSYLKENNSPSSGDLAYGNIVFRGENNNSTVPQSATLVDMDELGYVARVHNSTGYSVNDWVAGGTKETISQFVFELSDGDNGKTLPTYFSGKLLDHIGEENFVKSISGTAPAQNLIGVDRNNNNQLDEYEVVAEPDDVPPSSQLINAFEGVTLTGAGPDGDPTGFSITSVNTGSTNSSTGSFSFAYSGISQFSDIFKLRMDFLQPTGELNIDVTGGSSSGATMGAVEIYDEFGTLLDTLNTSLLSIGTTETVTATRPNKDIAYAIAYADSSAPRTSIYLDNLRFKQDEESAIASATGEYTISPVWDTGDTLLVKHFSTGNTEAVRSNELSATHVDFDLSFSLEANIFGRAADGSLQLAIPNILAGNGFTFENRGSLSPGATWDDILVADVNADGHDDVVGRTSGGQWWVAKGENNSFINEFWGRWSGAVQWDDVVVGDFNGDGADDIAGRTNGQWWLAKSQGDFFTVEYWGKWSTAVTWEDVMVGDFDGDGKDDIAGRANGDWWLARSNDTFFTVEYWGNWSNAVQWEDVSVGDFDGDGNDDIAGRANGQWWISRSQDTFFTVEYWGNWSNSVTWHDVLVADVNGDNQSDIVGRVNGTWWVSRSHGDYFSVENWGNWSTAVTWDDVVIVDVNADRMDDIVGITGGTFWATVSQGSYFTVEYWGNHPDAANWAHVQPASSTSGDIGGFSVGAASAEEFSIGRVTPNPVLGFDVLSSAAPLSLPFVDDNADEPGQELQPLLPVVSQARGAIRSAAVDSVFGSEF